MSRTVSESLAANVTYTDSSDLTDFEWFYDAIKARLKKSDGKTM